MMETRRLLEDQCGSWAYKPEPPISDLQALAPWIETLCRAIFEALGDFARIDSVDLVYTDSKERSLGGAQASWSALQPELRRGRLRSVDFWLWLLVSTGEGEVELGGSWLGLAVFDEPFEVSLSLELESNAYAGRGSLLSPEALSENARRLAAFLRRVEALPGVAFSYCESQAFPDRIARFGYRAP